MENQNILFPINQRTFYGHGFNFPMKTANFPMASAHPGARPRGAAACPLGRPRRQQHWQGRWSQDDVARFIRILWEFLRDSMRISVSFSGFQEGFSWTESAKLWISPRTRGKSMRITFLSGCITYLANHSRKWLVYPLVNQRARFWVIPSLDSNPTINSWSLPNVRFHMKCHPETTV